MAWAGVALDAEEIAAIVPVPEAVVDDAGDRPVGRGAGRARRGGRRRARRRPCSPAPNKPASWPEAIVPAAIAAGNTNVADSTPAQGGIANDIARDVRRRRGRRLRRDRRSRPRARCAGRCARRAAPTGRSSSTCRSGAGLDAPITYVANGVLRRADTLAVVGDYAMAVLGLRQDMTLQAARPGGDHRRHRQGDLQPARSRTCSRCG